MTRGGEDADRQRGWPRDHRGRGWSGYRPRSTSYHQSWKKQEVALPCGFRREPGPASPATRDLQPREPGKSILLLLKPLVYGLLLWRPRGTNSQEWGMVPVTKCPPCTRRGPGSCHISSLMRCTHCPAGRHPISRGGNRGSGEVKPEGQGHTAAERWSWWQT